jgi:hypothetical protein
MMTKIQKTWMWVFIAMFALPEILFFNTPLALISLSSNFSASDINPPIYFLINPQFFIDYPVFSLLVMIIEWLGVLGLFVISIKFSKKIPAILLGIILLWLSVELYLGYIISSMSVVF